MHWLNPGVSVILMSIVVCIRIKNEAKIAMQGTTEELYIRKYIGRLLYMVLLNIYTVHQTWSKLPWRVPLHNFTSECKFLFKVLLSMNTFNGTPCLAKIRNKNQKAGDTRFCLIHVIYNVEHQLLS